jgi:hypothetical protein
MGLLLDSVGSGAKSQASICGRTSLYPGGYTVVSGPIQSRRSGDAAGAWSSR